MTLTPEQVEQRREYGRKYREIERQRIADGCTRSPVYNLPRHALPDNSDC